MNSYLIFVVVLQVLIPLCRSSCRTSNGEQGVCQIPSDCKTSQQLTRCGVRAYVCCPARLVQLEDLKFPKECGLTPMYPREQIVGGKPVEPNEYIWLANLRYRNESVYRFCAGSVINSRYVLTAAHCVTGDSVREVGGLIGVRLGKFDDKGKMCDYGTEGCRHYQEFGIEKIIIHDDFKSNTTYVGNDIALIRVDRPIQFSNVTQPICLPFGSNRIKEPSVSTTLTVTGWGLTMAENDTGGKLDAVISLRERDNCNQHFRVDEKHLCAVELGKNSCNGDSGGPLMQQIDRKKMSLEGIVSYGIRNCLNTDYPGVYTRVRSYGEWLSEKMEM